MNVAVDNLDPARANFWLNNISSCLFNHVKNNDNHEGYVLVGVRSLVGVMLCVYVRDSLFHALHDVRWATHAVGVMGVMGNKGGVTCRYSLTKYV